jgi:hypothetical protein
MFRKIIDLIYDYFDQTPMFGYFFLVTVIFAVIFVLVSMGL